MFVARVPKFLNLSAAGHARLALPPAKIALVAARACLPSWAWVPLWSRCLV